MKHNFMTDDFKYRQDRIEELQSSWNAMLQETSVIYIVIIQSLDAMECAAACNINSEHVSHWTISLNRYFYKKLTIYTVKKFLKY
jgi:hypothetical protein